ncbi:MAG: hypothetical protein KKF77_03580 [Proteobacteria bacterium]|nr:hypothetical protein [Pseudomonadota bacterium]
MRITPIPDRSAEQPAEPCARHEVAAVFIVRANVCEGTTAAHLIEYVSAHLANREPDLHEDVFDELEGATMDVTGQEVRDELAPALFGQDEGKEQAA